ncbi:hypothetical protein TRVL_08413 [Trypanosoma vivax]|nr:hypothetical protein TRVL_08413 [Trypanosoma vivax]
MASPFQPSPFHSNWRWGLQCKIHTTNCCRDAIAQLRRSREAFALKPMKGFVGGPDSVSEMGRALFSLFQPASYASEGGRTRIKKHRESCEGLVGVFRFCRSEARRTEKALRRMPEG